MIAMVEGAKRQKTPNEIALDILLSALTLIFLLVRDAAAVSALRSRPRPAPGLHARAGRAARVPDPDDDRRPAQRHRHRGMDRLIRRNVIATSAAPSRPPATSTCCCSTRPAPSRSATAGDAFIPAPGVTAERLADAAQLASLADETPEGRSIVVLAKEKFGLRGRESPSRTRRSCRSPRRRA
jgi:K+-transporting ATPase ATPase B chain